MRASAAVLLGLLLISAPARADGPVESPQPTQPPPPPPPSGNEGPVQPVTTQEQTVEERKSGFEGGARLGVALPFGATDGNAQTENIGHYISATIPIWLDAGYRFGGRWYVGAYGIIAPGITNGANCPECSAANFKIGVNGHVHFIPEGTVDPFLGFGIGYEVVTITQKQLLNGLNQDVKVAAKGFEAANIQFGIDIRVTDLVRIRPFVGLSLDITTSESVTVGSQTTSVSDLDTTVHEWLSFGVGGVFNP